ncbi:MAG: hypothetical protein NTZ72_12270 [Afipia sp.]|jgi:hypothetical protein|nr:hypothetical protein [Afipia sp.]
MFGLFILFASLAIFAGPANADAFPKQLFNKTISLTWGEALGFESLVGHANGSNAYIGEKLIYVSSTGRPFVRYRLKGMGDSRSNVQFHQKLHSPDDEGSTQFQGGTVVSHQDFGGIVRRSVVTFDASFASCSLTQTIGKSSSSPTYTGLNGSEYKLTSSTVGSASCSIKDGNAVGG